MHLICIIICIFNLRLNILSEFISVLTGKIKIKHLAMSQKTQIFRIKFTWRPNTSNYSQKKDKTNSFCILKFIYTAR